MSPHSHTCTWKDLWRTQVRPKPTATHSDTAQAILRSACRPGSVYNVNLPQRAAVDAHASVSSPTGVTVHRTCGDRSATMGRHLRHVPRGVAVGRWSCVRWRPPRLSVISPSQCAPTRGARRCAKPHSVGRRCTAPTECFALRRSAVAGQSTGMARAAFSSAWATLVVLLSYSCRTLVLLLSYCCRTLVLYTPIRPISGTFGAQDASGRTSAEAERENRGRVQSHCH